MHGQDVLAELILPDLVATKEFAARFAPLLKAGDVVALDGALGAGKTELCRAIIHELGLADDVPSPTFNLLQIYEPAPEDQTGLGIWHLDLYRVENPAEIFELGIEEGYDTAAFLVEWPSKMGPYLPAGYLTFRLEIAADRGKRKLTIIGDRTWKVRLEDILMNMLLKCQGD